MRKLKVGEPSPQFSASDYLGTKIDLIDYRGKKVVISFLRGTTCPFCLARVKKLIKRNDELNNKGFSVINIVAAEKLEIVNSSKKNSAPFPIIPDPNEEVFEKFGILKVNFILLKVMFRPLLMIKVMMKNFSSMNFLFENSLYPADFVLDEEQNIVNVYYGKHLGDHLSIDDILKN